MSSSSEVLGNKRDETVSPAMRYLQFLLLVLASSSRAAPTFFLSLNEGSRSDGQMAESLQGKVTDNDKPWHSEVKLFK